MIRSAMNFLKLNTMLTALVLVISMYALAAQAAVVTVEEIQCTYDPKSGQPNPFGSRAFITVVQRGADTHFRYERFPSVVDVSTISDTDKVRAVTVESQRTLIFYNTEIEVARQLMRSNDEYYFQLIGRVDRAGYASYDEAMSCG